MSPPLSERAGAAMRWIGWTTIVTIALARALALTEILPGWDLDPLRMEVPSSALTPTWTTALDALAIAAAGLLLLGESVARRGVRLWALAALAIGAIATSVHAWSGGDRALDHLATGGSWLAAVAGALAIAHACRHPRLARLTAALVAGLVGVLVLKGAMQVYVDHAETVRQFRANRDMFLQSQGMLPGSVSAKLFERRLNQPEATGWFGLSNVYATFVAAIFAMIAGWTVLARGRVANPLDRPSEGWAAVLGIGMFAAAFGVVLAGSKGGYVAAAMGVAVSIASVTLFAPVSRPFRWPRIGAALALALVVAALGAVVARGLIGERVGELSLLFRWFYIQAAWTIGLDHLPLGVGPAGFKDAYLIAKPAISPEEVSSPHSVLFDWWATLGVGGVAWIGLWLSWVAASGRNLVSSAPHTEDDPARRRSPSSLAGGEARSDLRLVGIITAAVVTLSLFVERSTLTPEAAAMRILGLLAWIFVTVGVLALMRTAVGESRWRGPFAAGALVVAVHSQIELTLVWSSSASLAMLILAAAGATLLDDRTSRSASRGLARFAGLAGSFGVLGLGVAWGGVFWVPVRAWERELSAARDAVQPVARFRSRAEAIAAGRGTSMDGDTMPRLAADVGEAIGTFPPRDQQGFERAMAELTSRVSIAAGRHLERAIELFPTHFPTREAFARLTMNLAATELKLGRPESARKAADAAVVVIEAAPPSAASLATLGNLFAARSQIEREPRQLGRAIDAWTRAADLDPFSVSLRVRLALACRDAGRPGDAAVWANRALEASALQRLDPLRQLPESETRLLRDLAAEAESTAKPVPNTPEAVP